MGKEIKWVLGQGSGEDQPVERRAHYPEQRGRHVFVMLIPQALECVAWISKQRAMSKKVLVSAFLNFKQFGNRLARPVSMVYNGETNGRRSIGATLAEF